MVSYKGQIPNPAVRILPSEKLLNYIKTIKVDSELQIPHNIATIIFKNKSREVQDIKPKDPNFLLKAEDFNFIKSISDKLPEVSEPGVIENRAKGTKFLSNADVHWIYKYIQEHEFPKGRIHFHELYEGSVVEFPKNLEVPRNPDLEKRCEKLRKAQETKMYQDMTKNVDSIRKKLPEDTLSYQLKEMNRHLIAIFQFIVSVLAGFAFGFLGLEVFVGSLDFGFRLLMGIIFALIIALAELYFLAKKLNEDINYDPLATKKKDVKVD